MKQVKHLKQGETPETLNVFKFSKWYLNLPAQIIIQPS